MKKEDTKRSTHTAKIRLKVHFFLVNKCNWIQRKFFLGSGRSEIKWILQRYKQYEMQWHIGEERDVMFLQMKKGKKHPCISDGFRAPFWEGYSENFGMEIFVLFEDPKIR